MLSSVSMTKSGWAELRRKLRLKRIPSQAMSTDRRPGDSGENPA